MLASGFTEAQCQVPSCRSARHVPCLGKGCWFVKSLLKGCFSFCVPFHKKSRILMVILNQQKVTTDKIK